MADEDVTVDDPERRLKWYGTSDYGTFYQTERAAELLAGFEPSKPVTEVNDVLELHNARQFAEHGILPQSYSDAQVAEAKTQVAAIDAAVTRFFAQLDANNIADRIRGLDFNYQRDLLDLLALRGVLKRVDGPSMLEALDMADVRLGEMLLSRNLVRAYDTEVHELVMADPRNAEHVIRKNLERDPGNELHLPPSMSSGEARALIDAYLDLQDPNPNFVQLVAHAAASSGLDAGVDNKLRLKASRKFEEVTKAFFAGNTGFKFGCEVSVVDDQSEAVEATIEGTTAKYSYSRAWLEDNLDYPTILNNFPHLFEYATQHMLLTLPAFTSELGVMERVIGVGGKSDYQVGAAFRVKDQGSFLQAIMYDRFLTNHDIQLEQVLAWFFEQYLRDEFGVERFHFSVSSPTATYLERCRQLFAEMESVAKQYMLYVENGELDVDLLAMTDQFKYKALPSVMAGKYAYGADNSDIKNIMHLLFSDQSSIHYISETLSAEDTVHLLIGNQVAYEDFHEYQRPAIDYLIAQGILVNEEGRVQFADLRQIQILKELSAYEAIAYYHYSDRSREIIDDMVNKGWLVRESALLTASEASYFNYFLNNSEFGNGPALRNQYAHGSPSGDDNAHFQAYSVALRLLICLVIKINDDLSLRAGSPQGPGKVAFLGVSCGDTPEVR